MKKEIQITKEIANHELNSECNLQEGATIEYELDPVDKPCPPDTSAGYYIRSGGNCVFVPFG